MSSGTPTESMKSEARAETVLIFQIGSLGDTVISMPCYREIARRHPHAKRLLLTNFSKGSKMVQAEALLKPGGLIEGSVEYPMPLRGLGNILKLFRTLRKLNVDRLYYLSPETRIINLIRHWLFFKLCGVRQLKAMPWSHDRMHSRELVPGKLWETEGSRLLRNLDHSRPAGPPNPADRSLDFTDEELQSADVILSEMPSGQAYVAFSIGGRIPVKDWGDENWSSVLHMLSKAQPELGLVMVGSLDERERNDQLASHWFGPTLNACGRLSPRETAAVIERAAVFLGHDTGTMHLAAAVDTRVVAVFCARNKPGIWYSDRPEDHFFYHQPPCFDCEISEPSECKHGLVCMTEHSRTAVVDVTTSMLTRTLAVPAYRHNRQ